MAYYNRRDLIGHWVRKRQPTQRMCTHACCRGKRVHPDNYPVVLPDRLLKHASDKDLADAYDKYDNQQRRDQILHEMDRRDLAAARKEERKRQARHRLFARQMERQEHIEYAYLQAEQDTRGHLLNKAGRAQDIDPRSLFTGSESRARRYASEELLNHWETHHRPTAGMMRGRDTRVAYEYDMRDRRKRRRAA